MGYTHYWSKKQKTTQKQWDEFLEICITLKNNLPKNTNSAGGYYLDEPLVIGGNNIDEEAIFDEKMIFFNGQTSELGHETFCIENNKDTYDFEFCKTARKPYDLLVCACLIAGNKTLGLNVSSDGNVEDWKPAFKFYDKIIGLVFNDEIIAKFLKDDE